jgi:hypothetical protein
MTAYVLDHALWLHQDDEETVKAMHRSSARHFDAQASGVHVPGSAAIVALTTISPTCGGPKYCRFECASWTMGSNSIA